MKWNSLKHSAARSLCLYAVAVATLPSALAQSASLAQQLSPRRSTRPAGSPSPETPAPKPTPRTIAEPSATASNCSTCSSSSSAPPTVRPRSPPASRPCTTGNPLFHQWLTAEQIGTDYGLNPSDLTAITTWMQSHGFQINSVAPSGTVIDFSGTAAQVKSAFKTELHTLSVNGEPHIANMQNPQIPAALAGVVAGVVSLHDFHPHTFHRDVVSAHVDPKTQNLLAPDYTFTSGTSRCDSGRRPGRSATIYNFNPLFAAGISGQGQTIVVIEDTNLYNTADWTTSRWYLRTVGIHGLGSFTPMLIPRRPPARTTARTRAPTAPGWCRPTLDAEWASAAAPSAAIELVFFCADTRTSFGGLIALQNPSYASTRAPPAVVSISYGE